MTRFDPTRFRWPVAWKALTGDDRGALAFGRFINPDIAPTVSAELRREICDRHPLAGAACQPVAWNAAGGKDFLFLTDRPDMPVALVHFTWGFESDPAWPFVIRYRNLSHFVGRERRWVAEARVGLGRWWTRNNGG